MYLDCENCKAYESVETRQAMGCGFLPRSDQSRNLPMAHEYEGPLQEEGDTCAGWYLSLPAVVEVVIAHAWWEKSQLRELQDEPPSPALSAGVTLFAGACSQVESFVHRRAREDAHGPR